MPKFNAIPNIYSRFLPIGTFILLLAAIFETGLYYSYFKVNIFTYLTLAEIISLFISSTPILILISAIIIFYLFIIETILEKKIIWIQKINFYNAYIRRKYFLKHFLITGLLFFIWTFYILFSPMISRNFVRTDTFIAGKLIISFLILVWVSFSISPKAKYTDNTNSTTAYSLFFIIIFFISIYFKVTISVFSLKERPNSRSRVSVIFNDSTQLKTDTEVFFIGKTKEYIFFYKADTINKTVIYKMDNIKELNIRSFPPSYFVP